MERPIVLAVDDDPGVLAAIQRDLRSEYGDDYRVIGADSGSRALDMTRQLRQRGDAVALFLVDQRMPGMTGVEFLEHSLALYPEAKRALLTAYADTDAAIRAINSVKMDHYLMKPWDPPEEQLFPVLSDLLEDWKAHFRPQFEGVSVVCDRWSPGSHAVKDFLARNHVPFRWLDIESNTEAMQLLDLAGVHEPKMPALIFPDGSVLEAPTNRDIAEKVGLQTEAERQFYDLIIVGAGPAGLSAAVYGGTSGLKTLVIERQAPGGQAGMSPRIENYLGFPVGLSGGDLARRAVAQARRLGAEMLTTEEVVGLVTSDSSYHGVRLSDGSELGSHALIIATGVQYRQLQQPGIARLTGAGVYYGAAMTEGQSVKGEDVFVVGGANSAGQAAMYFSEYARSVTIMCRAESLSVSMARYLVDRIEAADNINVYESTEVNEAHGDDHLEALSIVHRDTGQEERADATALFIFIGATPATDWYADLVDRDEHGFVLSGGELNGTKGIWPLDRPPFPLETNIPGVFVAGDVRHGSLKRVVAAVNEGGMAVNLVLDHMRELGL